MSRRDIGTDDLRVHVRPGKGSRPRTKIRPDYSQARRGRVTAVDRGRYAVTMIDDSTRVTAVKARELPRGSVVVGDVCAVVGDLSGREGTLARIARVDERTTALRRTAEDGDTAGYERVIVANADQMMIVAALAQPDPKPGFIDRCLVAAYDAGLEPVLVLTKADLASPDRLLSSYAPLDLRIVVTAIPQNYADSSLAPEPGTSSAGSSFSIAADSDLFTGDSHAFSEGASSIAAVLRGHTSVFIGHSGVGKSTLINALVPEAERATGGVNSVTGKGRHTSTSAVAFNIDDGRTHGRTGTETGTGKHTNPTVVIDTPGVRGFGLAHVSPDSLLRGFPDLMRIVEDCPRGCTHHSDEHECALCGIEELRLKARIASYQRLLKEIDPHH